MAIVGRKVLQAMDKAGILPPMCREMVIRIPINGAVTFEPTCFTEEVTLDAVLRILDDEERNSSSKPTPTEETPAGP